MAENQRRRRRVRAPETAEAATEFADAAEVTESAEPTPVPGLESVAQTSPVYEELWAGAADVGTPISERGLRGLVGGGSSQVSPTVALRARDAARPRPEEIDRAEAELTIVRRHWAPRD